MLLRILSFSGLSCSYNNQLCLRLFLTWCFAMSSSIYTNLVIAIFQGLFVCYSHSFCVWFLFARTFKQNYGTTFTMFTKFISICPGHFIWESLWSGQRHCVLFKRCFSKKTDLALWLQNLNHRSIDIVGSLSSIVQGATGQRPPFIWFKKFGNFCFPPNQSRKTILQCVLKNHNFSITRRVFKGSNATGLERRCFCLVSHIIVCHWRSP